MDIYFDNNNILLLDNNFDYYDYNKHLDNNLISEYIFNNIDYDNFDDLINNSVYYVLNKRYNCFF